ncbi:hypothetical protein HQ571_06730 [Candidatus Kuenenbacteria bacterium]|nr:hypothetical protein [Candidatus Kuenenbacteria bacterium]
MPELSENAVGIEIKDKTVEQVFNEMVQSLTDLGFGNEDGGVTLGEWSAIATSEPKGSIAFMLEKVTFIFVDADDAWFKKFEEVLAHEPQEKTEIEVMDESEAKSMMERFHQWSAQICAEFDPTFDYEMQKAARVLELMRKMRDLQLIQSALPGTNNFQILHDKLNDLIYLADERYFPLSHVLGDFYLLRARMLEAQSLYLPTLAGQDKLWDEIIETYQFSLENFRLSAVNCLKQCKENEDLSLVFRSAHLQQTNAYLLSVLGRLVSAMVARKLIERGVTIHSWPDEVKMVELLENDQEIREDELIVANLESCTEIAEIGMAIPFISTRLVVPFILNHAIVLVYKREFDEARRLYEFVLSLEPDMPQAKKGLAIMEDYEAKKSE